MIDLEILSECKFMLHTVYNVYHLLERNDFKEIMMRRVGDLPVIIFEWGNALVDLASTQHIQHKSEGSAYK